MNLVFVADNNYATQFAITLHSVVKSNPNVAINAYLVTCGISIDRLERIKCLVEKDGVVLHLCHIYEQRLDWLKPMENGWSRFMFLKLYIPEVLPENIDKALYLDVDMIVVENLSELYGIKLNDYALAAVEDTPDSVLHKRRCGIDADLPYINSGVMLINMKLWRAVSSQRGFWRFIEERMEEMSINDQDVINTVFQNQILTLPLKFNVTNHCYGFRPNVFTYQKLQLSEVYRHPVIIHFTNWNKPWKKEAAHLFAKKWISLYKEVNYITGLAIDINYSKGKNLLSLLINKLKLNLWRIYKLKYRWN